MAAQGVPSRSSGWPQIGTAVLALVAFGLALAGMTAPGRLPGVDIVYRSLQLFVFEGSALPNGTQGNPLLEIARFLAPTSGLLAILVALRSLLWEELGRRRIARSRRHAIVCGDGPAAVALAGNLRDVGRDVVLIDSAGSVGLRRDGIDVVAGDPRQPSTLRAAGVRRAAYLYACAPQSATNAAVVLAAGPLRAGRSRGRLAGFAQVRNNDLVEALRVRQFAGAGQPGYSIDFFAIDDTAARLLLDEHDPGDGTTPVVIVGFTSFGQSLLRAIARRPGPGGQRRSVVVRTEDAQAVRAFAHEFEAESRGCDVTAIPVGGDLPGDATRFYVCDEDEDSAVANALRLARQPGRNVVACLPRNAPFRDALGQVINVFGILDAACQEATIAADSVIGRAARSIHENYLAAGVGRGDSPAVNPSMRPWPDLAPHLRESNFAQAEHIGAKLSQIGVVLGTTPGADAFTFTDAEVNQLARLEHVRWMDERLAAGFTHGPRREGRQLPDLVDWPQLSEESRQKDVDAVRHLPALLASAGLYISRPTGG